MAERWQIFLNAVMFFTRIPVPAQYSEERLNKASAFFPLVGWIVAAAAIAVWFLAASVMSPVLAVWLSIAATIWLTGAFHEDGFADFCDGFGGGYTQERILEIMKDSRIGTYGTVGLILMLACKGFALADLPKEGVPVAMFLAHALSRAASASLIYFGSYVRADLLSKAKPLSTRMSRGDLALALCFGLIPLVFIPVTAWWLLAPVALATWIFYRYCKKWIGGYTGDCLGAIQQITELVILLCLVVGQGELSA